MFTGDWALLLNAHRRLALPLNAHRRLALPLNTHRRLVLPLNTHRRLVLPLSAHRRLALPLNAHRRLALPLNAHRRLALPLNDHLILNTSIKFSTELGPSRGWTKCKEAVCCTKSLTIIRAPQFSYPYVSSYSSHFSCTLASYPWGLGRCYLCQEASYYNINSSVIFLSF